MNKFEFIQGKRCIQKIDTCTRTSEILKTSEEWNKEDKHIIKSPDGWDRNENFHWSFYEEKITHQEYKRRLNLSTILYAIR